MCHRSMMLVLYLLHVFSSVAVGNIQSLKDSTASDCNKNTYKNKTFMRNTYMKHILNPWPAHDCKIAESLTLTSNVQQPDHIETTEKSKG